MKRYLSHTIAIALIGILGSVLAQEVEDQDAKEPIANATNEPPIKLVPSQNLFGETIANAVTKQTETGPSQNVKRVASLLEVSLESNNKLSLIETRYKDTVRQLSEKSTQLDQLPNRYQAAVGKYAELEQKRVAMLPYLAIAQTNGNPKINSIAQDHNNVKAVISGLIGDIRLMEQQQRTLPVEIQNLKAELIEIRKSQTAVGREIFETVASWSELLSVLRFLPKEDAESILTACQLKLDTYPEAHLIRALKAFAALQLSKTEAALLDLRRVIQATDAYNDNLAKEIRLRCLVGVAWACILQNDLDGAGVALGNARKLNGRDYETAVLISHLTDLRGKPTIAFSLYKNATAIAPKRPEAYRLASEMTIKSGIRDPQTALQLAKMACKQDQNDDYRNALSLARAHHACGDEKARDEAIAKAYEQAGDTAMSAIEKCKSELANAKP